MRKLFLLLAGTSSMVIASCGEKKETGTTNGTAEMTNKIAGIEKSMDLNNPDPTKVNELLKLYTRFADSLPKDQHSPVYLMKASDLYHIQGKYTLKCQMYENVIEKFPNFKDMDMVMYLYALSLDSELNLRERAKVQYQRYIEKFPKSQYVSDAQARLTTIDSLSFKELQDRITDNALKQAH